MRSKAEKFSIGVLIGNVHSPHTVDLMLGMEEAAAQLDANIFYFLGTHSSHLLEYLFGRGTKANYDYQFNTIYDYAHLAKLDALIISYGSLCIFLENTSKEEFLERFRNIPYILIEDIEDREDTNNLLTDNIGGMTLLVEHLLRDHGYTKVTYISGPIGNRDGDQRRDTVKQLCAQYHVPLPEDAIEYGNYSQHVYEQAHKLLDRYPDTEVIICANDEMALGACQVCEARGLIVGKDIAVTGFDNNMNAQLAKIPLTTVKQSGFDMGYQSIQSAMKLCHGERVGRTLIPTKFIPRESCGCKNVTLSSTPFIQEDGDIHDASYIARQITKSIIESRQNPQMFEKIYQTTKRMVEGGLLLADPKASTSSHDAMNQILDALTELTGDEMLPYISRSTLDNLNIDWLEHLSTCVTDTQTHNNMLRVLSKIQSKRWALTLYDSSRELEELTCKSWALQIVAREMTERVDSTEAFYESALGNLKMFGVHSSYIYLLDEVMIHRPHMTRKQPERLHLAAWHCEDEVVSYKRDERPVIDASNGFAPFLKKAGKQYFGFILFSDERQYGLMFCEIESKDVAILYFISLQIGSALRFYELHNKEVRVRNQLEESLQTIQAQNTLLSFISENDDLTNLYNRKGFMERALKLNANNDYVGQKALLIFADLDHLKEVNDFYGHSEGDFALINAATILRDTCPSNFILGRLGGDEFVALGILPESLSLKALETGITETFADFNVASDKPFYVELSYGYYEFILGAEKDFSIVLDKADELLYENKKGRRHSVVKSDNL